MIRQQVRGECSAIASLQVPVLLLVCISFIAFHMTRPLACPTLPSRYPKSFALPLRNPSLPSNEPMTAVEQSKLTETPRVTVRAFLVFYKGIPNYEVALAWVEFHLKRWGLTHVDVYVKENLAEMRAILNDAFRDSVKIDVYYTHFHAKVVAGTGLNGQILVMMNSVLQRAKRDNNTFVILFDPDEFLVSDDFQNLEDMFQGGHHAVSFPMFGSYYHICSDNALVFGSLGYHVTKPFGSKYTNNASLDYYTEPPVSCGGHRKHIVRPEKWDRVGHIHDPIKCSTGITRYDLPSEVRRRILHVSGRHQDGEHARLIHARTGIGIHSDISMQACLKIRSCKYVTGFEGKCTDILENATWQLKGTEVNEWLKDHPLFPDAAQVSIDAVCYAGRSPSLLKDLCDDDVSKCRYGALYRHYHDIGKDNNLTWGCKV